jgi:hypothetical protein
MVRQCLESKAEILFNPTALKDIGIQRMPSNNAEVKDEAPLDCDRDDAICEPHSPFKGINSWWILELIPMRRHFPQIENGKIVEGKWKQKIRSVVRRSSCTVLICGVLNIFDRTNLFRGRDIWPKEGGVNVHSSVKVRMDDPKANYEPKAKWPGEVNWVD